MAEFDVTKARFIGDRKYAPELCDEILEHFAEGMTITQVCVMLGVTHQAFNDWRKKYPEFNQAAAFGLQIAQSLKEKTADKGVVGEIDNFNASMHKFLMAAQFKDAYGATEAPALDADAIQTALESALEKHREASEKDA